MRTLFFAIVMMGLSTAPTLGFSAATQESYQAVFDSAEAVRKQAAAVGYEWRDTKKMLKTSQKLASEGKFDKAQALAEKAQKQSEAALEQAALQSKIWMDSVPK